MLLGIFFQTELVLNQENNISNYEDKRKHDVNNGLLKFSRQYSSFSPSRSN